MLGRIGLGKRFGLRGGGLGRAGGSAPADVWPVAGLTKTFEYKPSRDGLALLTGGPTLAGYQANKQANPSRIWMPRFDDVSLNSKGTSDTSSGNYSWQADPEFAWSNAYSPFSINGSGNLVIRAQTSATVAPAFAGGELPTNSVISAAYSWVSGMLSTQASFSQSGGYFELTAKLPNSKGSWPAFWMYAPIGNSQKISHPPEIDVLEYLGGLDANTTERVNVISNGPVQHSQSIVAGSNLSSGFHKYGVYVDDSAVTFYLDGIAVGTPQSITALPEFIQPMFLLLSNQVGSTLGGWVPPPDGTTITPLDMEISLVRVGQRTGPVALELSHLAYLDSFTVGQTVATISVTNYGASSGNTVTITADPDSMFTVSGLNLNLAQVVPESTKATHSVTLRVTDSGSKTLTRTFTIRAVAAVPAGTNLIAQPTDISNVYWSKADASDVITSTDTLTESATTSQHGIFKANEARSAGVLTYRASIDIEPISSRYTHLLQLFDGNFGGTGGSTAYYDLQANRLLFSTALGAWASISAWQPAKIPGSTKVRIGYDITTDASSTNFTFFPQLLQDAYNVSGYLGDVTKGAKITNLMLMSSWVLAGAALDFDFVNARIFGDTIANLFTVTRASAGTAFNSDGTVSVFGSNVLRYGTRGYYDEESRTNNLLWSRDLTNAAWTKTNITPTATTGADGTASAATRLTGTAANGTVLQSITLASSQRKQSAVVKRITGSGNVDMTTDGGTTWTTLTLAGAGTWTQVEIAAQTVTNPSVGFRLVTSGDVVDIDFVQNETGAFKTTPIITTTVAATRATETLTPGGVLNTVMTGSAGSLIMEMDPLPNVSVVRRIFNYAGGTFCGFNSATQGTLSDGTNTILVSSPVNVTSNITKNGYSWGAAGFAGVINNGTLATNASGNRTTATGAIQFNDTSTFNRTSDCAIRRLTVWSSQLANATLKANTA